MAFYGFNYQKKNRGDTARSVGAIGAQAAVAIPEAKRKDDEYKYVQEQRKKAAEAIKADTDLASDNWKTWKETYSKQAAQLVKAGKMTEEELQSDLKMFPMPRSTDLLTTESIGKYLDRFSGQTAELLKKLDTRRKALMEEQKTTATGESVQGSIAGKPPETAQPVPIKGPGGETQFTETDIGAGGQPLQTSPGIPEAKTREEASKRIDPSITSKQAEQVPAYKELPSQADIEKQKRLSQKESRLQEMNDYQEAMMSYRYAKLGYQKTKDEKTLRLAEDRGKQAINKLVSSIENKQIAQIDDEINKLKKPEPDMLGETPPVDYDAIAELETQKKNLKDQIDQLNAEKKMFGAVKEKRSFSSTGKETSRTPTGIPTKTPQPTTQPKKGGGF